MIVSPRPIFSAEKAAEAPTPDPAHIDQQLADAEMRVRVCEDIVARGKLQLLTAIAVAATLREVQAHGIAPPAPPTESYGEYDDDRGEMLR